jgi:hypothetical protein
VSKKHINQNAMKLREQKNTKIVANIKMQRNQASKKYLAKVGHA